MPNIKFFLSTSWVVALITMISLVTNAQAENLRVATWNVSNYTTSSTINSDLQNSLFSSFQGRSLAPDILFAQEIQSPQAAANFTSAMNSAAGSSGDWNLAFGSLTGTSVTSDTAMFYRSSKVNSVSPFLVAAAGGTSANPRDIWRFDFSLRNNAAANEVFSVYNLHAKAGNTTTDEARRQVEAQAVRNNANGLAANHQIMVAGDMNWQSSVEASFGTYTSSTGNTRGRFFDPINTPGNWNGNNNFRFVHTQDPSGPGGMDDRYDALLFGSGLRDGIGTEYVGNFNAVYSTSTWNDPNHSYRVWGNDGTSFDTSLKITGNTMVGASIAQSLVNVAGPAGGHLPVFLDLNFTAVPEPSSLVVVGSGLAILLMRRRKFWG